MYSCRPPYGCNHISIGADIVEHQLSAMVCMIIDHPKLANSIQGATATATARAAELTAIMAAASTMIGK